MFLLVTLVQLLALASAFEGFEDFQEFQEDRQNVEGKIVLGSDVEISQYPYNAALIYRGALRCTASIINEEWILTAAHCTNGIRDASSLSIRAGSTFQDDGGQLIVVDEIHQHPKYNKPTFDYDISLLHLSESLQMNENITAVEIAHSKPMIYKNCLSTGWGTKNAIGIGTSKRLRSVSLPIVPRLFCEARWLLSVTGRQICAGKVTGISGVCFGDSGGPLMCDGKQVGIASYTKAICNLPATPSVFTWVGHKKIREFITSITKVGV